MNVASLSLCKELYELSGWEPSEFLRHGEYSDLRWWHNKYEEPEVIPQLSPSYSDIMHDIVAPAYDLGYLLRKLPNSVTKRVNHWLEISPVRQGQWRAMYTWEPFTKYADTPENATAKLAIELFKQGILTKGDK